METLTEKRVGGQVNSEGELESVLICGTNTKAAPVSLMTAGLLGDGMTLTSLYHNLLRQWAI